jgi:dinuclear metal center YbgI/SA1388 family protein
MILLSQLQSYLNDYLYFDKKMDISKIDPYMTNGLMVKGKEEVKKIGFGVSASLALFEKAKKTGCDALIVHHSFNLPPYNRYDSLFQNRIGYLVKNDMSLFGYHFLLDAHPEVGNNIRILQVINATPEEPYFFAGAPWGWEGTLQKEKSIEDIFSLLKPYLSPRVISYRLGPSMIRKVVAVSGKGAPRSSEMTDLLEKKIDLYITGEAHEWNRELFAEAKINFIAGGHYHTEMFGVKTLMEKVKNTFPTIATQWIDLINEV